MAEGILIENVVKTYGSGDTAVHALRGVDMAVTKGEVVGLIGPSGSGKSTLLKCLGAVIEPTSCKMTIGDQCIYGARSDPVPGCDRQCGRAANACGPAQCDGPHGSP